MSSAAQLAANQANATHSTGPVSETGKVASSRNHLRHGFRSQTVLLPCVTCHDPAEYQALLADLTEHLAPRDLTDTRFVREMADADWCLRPRPSNGKPVPHTPRHPGARTPVHRGRNPQPNRNLLRNMAALRNQIRTPV